MAEEIIKPVRRSATRTEHYYLTVSENEHEEYKGSAARAGITLADWARDALNEYVELLRSPSSSPDDVATELRSLTIEKPYSRWIKAGKRKAIHFTQTPEEGLALLAFVASLKARLKRDFDYDVAVKGRYVTRGKVKGQIRDIQTEALVLLSGKLGRAALRYKATHSDDPPGA